MQAKPNRRAIIVGLFIFIGMLVLLAGILTVGNLHSTFVKKIGVTVLFDNVNGLQAGNNIWFSGVKIGTVKKMSFFGESQVKVQLKIDEKAQQYIRRDAKVKIGTDGLIGNKIIVIYGGTPHSAQVEDGDTLGIERSVSSDEMMAVLQQNNQNLLAITADFKSISHKLASDEGSIGKLLKDESLYNSLGTTLASLQRSSANAEKLTASVSGFGEKLNRKGSLANDLVSDTTIFRNVQSASRQLKQLTASASESVEKLKAASASVGKATAQLDNPNTPLGVLLYDENSAAHLKSTLGSLDGGAQKLDENLRALQSNFLFRRYFKKKKKAEEAAAKQ